MRPASEQAPVSEQLFRRKKRSYFGFGWGFFVCIILAHPLKLEHESFLDLTFRYSTSTSISYYFLHVLGNTLTGTIFRLLS